MSANEREGRRIRSHGTFGKSALGAAMATAAGALAFALAWGTPGQGGKATWLMIGGDSGNNRAQALEHKIGVGNVAGLGVKWKATTTGDVSATPAVADGAIYFGDFGGTEWKLDAATGNVIWSHKVSEYTGIDGDVSRSSPALAGDTLVIGDLSAPNVMGIDVKTGKMRWITKLDDDPHGIITGSPVLAGDTIYVGSSQMGASSYPGVLVALNAQTGKVIWRVFSMPNPDGAAGGYSGGVMLGAPTVDVSDGLVFAAFKSAEGEPAAVKACNRTAANGFSESCEQPGAYHSSLVAFDMKTGKAVWSYRAFGDVAWKNACGSQPTTVTWCGAESDNPLSGGGDQWDFGGSAPNVFEMGSGRDRRTVVGVGQKSGLYLLLDAKTGKFIWNTLVGPGGDMGGIAWGSAYDGKRIYVSISNQHHAAYRMTENGNLTDTTSTGGSWAALDPATGKIIWQRADPQTEVLNGKTVNVWDYAPVSVANGVVYAGSMAKSGNEFYALDAATGEILWTFSAGSSVNAGPAIVDGSVYWGSGYSKARAEGNGGTTFFAFALH
jgi:polyvinyl alcohol dehydrogenase (cytochrome)